MHTRTRHTHVLIARALVLLAERGVAQQHQALGRRWRHAAVVAAQRHDVRKVQTLAEAEENRKRVNKRQMISFFICYAWAQVYEIID